MKVLLVFPHVNFFRSLEPVARELHRGGHEVTVLHGTRGLEGNPTAVSEHSAPKAPHKERKAAMLRRTVELAQAEMPGVTFSYRPEPTERWQRKLLVGRRVMNRAIYLRKGHPAPARRVEALDKMIPPKVLSRLQAGPFRAAVARPFTLKLWRRIEAASPPSGTVRRVLEEIGPDVVVVSPSVWAKEPVEADYVRAARSLRIPTVGFVASWDNLTSKGTVHLLPDVFAVWNEPLAREAVEIHDVPRRRIRVTGAPYIDHFFELSQTVSPPEMCATMGCPPDRPYVAYLCSSPTLISDETPVVARLADELARQLGADAPTVVARPHPVNPGAWEEFEHPGVGVYPRSGDLAAGDSAWQDYYNQLAGAVCAVGLNTTAFLEAVVADRPCLTIVADEFHAQQGYTGHFRHLVDADFLEVCDSIPRVAARVGRILAGEDAKRENRHRFRGAFLRPRGVETPAAASVVALIEELAGRRRRRHLRGRAAEATVLSAQDAPVD